jgi:tetratricopeptide (TPR) repeat protein
MLRAVELDARSGSVALMAVLPDLRSATFPVLLTLVTACAGPAPAASPPTTHPASTAQQADQEQLQKNLEAAELAYERNPDDAMTSVWLGRRLGYVGRYEDAVAAFTRGLERHPDSAWLLRFRGHRYITLRRFDDAVRDLERAHELALKRPDEVEPDGAPNKAGVPIGTLRSNIDYHLGLAHFLRGDFESAWRVYEAGFEIARTNDDRLVSHTYWSWLTLQRLGRKQRASELLVPIRADMHIVENDGYLALLRLFRGDVTEADVLKDLEPGKTEFATRYYGASMKRIFNGDLRGARHMLERAAAGPKAAFGCIAAEVELARYPQ